MIEVDCLGDMCPVPVIKVQQTLKAIEKGESLKLITDHSCVVQSILDKYKSSKSQIKVEEVINGVWEIVITKY